MLAGGQRPRDRRRRGQRQALPLHRQLRLRLRREPDRQRGASWSRAASSTPTRRCGRWSPGSRRAFTLTLDGERPQFTGYSVAAANSKAYGGGMFVAPDAELDDGLLDVVIDGRGRQAPLPRQPAEGLQGRARRATPRCRSARAAEVRIEADRPFAVYADGDHLADLPATVRLLPRALRRDRAAMSAAAALGGAGFRRQARARRARPARSAGAAAAAAAPRCPGRLLLRIAPDAIARLGARLDARLDDRQRHQRQDDDRGDDRRGAARRRARPGPQPRRLEHELGRRHGAARAARRARACSRSTRPGCRGSPPQLDPRLIVLGNLFRDQLDRYGELEQLADEWAAMVARARRQHRLRAQRRRPAGRRPRPRPRAAPPPGVTYFGIEDPSQALPELQHAHDAKHCRRCGAPLRLRARLRRPPRPLRVPELRRRPARARRRRDRDRAARDAAARGRRSARPRASCELELPLPGLYNVYNALAALAAGAAARGRARARPGRAGARSRRPSGGSRRSTVAGRPVSILLIKNPAGANEVLRTLRLEAADRARTAPGSTSGSRSTTGSPTAATSPGSGTPTSSCSPGAARRVVCAGTRAPEMAVRLKYAGIDPSAIEVEPSIERSLDRAVAARRRPRSSRCRPTRR